MIQNRKELDTTELRKKALDIVEAGINKVLPENIMSSLRINEGVLSVGDENFKFSRLFVIGGGKASGLMARCVESLGIENITSGIVNCTSHYDTQKIEIVEARHPTPDERGVIGVNKMLAIREEFGIKKGDLILVLISGGGSAVMPSPVDGVTLEDKQNITKMLLASGAEIHEINTVRKHLSKIKGGQLGKFFEPATVVSIIISDVIGNMLDVIASGPTVPDPSTFDDALAVIKKYDIKPPSAVMDYLEKKENETPKKLFNCHNFILGDNMIALEGMRDRAMELGLKPFILSGEQKGDPGKAAEERAAEIIKGNFMDSNAIIIGGETTPTLPDNPGKGGRNQHFAAVSMVSMKDFPRPWALASVGTDGSDFIQDAAGGIVDSTSLQMAEDRGLDANDFIKRYDTFPLLEKLGSIIVTGNTGTNVCDIIVYVLEDG